MSATDHILSQWAESDAAVDAIANYTGPRRTSESDLAVDAFLKAEQH